MKAHQICLTQSYVCSNAGKGDGSLHCTETGLGESQGFTGKGKRYDQDYKDMIVDLFKSGMSVSEINTEPLKKLMLLFLSILKVGITGEDCTLLLIT